MNKGIIRLAAAAAFAFAMAPASAAIVEDGDWDCSWLSFSTAYTGTCFGSVNPPPNDGLSAINEIFATTFDQSAKDNESGAGTTTVVFDAVSTGLAAGTINFLTSVTDPFVLVVKLGQGWSAYQFDTDFLAGSTLTWGPTGEFNFGVTTGLGLSHASIYSTNLCPNGDCQTEELPEPGSLALLGAGLAALSLTRRRRLRV